MASSRDVTTRPKFLNVPATVCETSIISESESYSAIHKNRVGAKAPARFLCVRKEDHLPEIVEITHTKVNFFQHLGFVIAAFDI